MGVRSIQVRISQIGGRTVAQDIANIGTAAARTGGQLTLANKILQGFAAAAALRRISTFADSFTQLRSRTKIYTDSQEEANKVSNEIVKIANRTRVSLDAVSLTYQRLAIVQGRLGLSTERVTRLVELLSKAVVIGGSNAQEAGGALRQFSQALSNDFKAAAQELNSVLEQTPGLAAALAAGLGVGIDQIKVLAKEGKLNSDLVVRALESQADVIEARFGRVAPTISGSFQILENALTVFIGRAAEVGGVTRFIFDNIVRLADRMIELANDTEKLSAILETLGTVIGALGVEFLTQKLLTAGRAMIFFSVQTARATTSSLASFAGGLISAGSAVTRFGSATVAALTTPITRATFSLANLGVAARGLVGGLGAAATAFGRFATAAAGVALNAATAGLGVFLALVVSVRNELVKTTDGGFVRFQDVALATLSVVTDRLREFIDTLVGSLGPNSSAQSNARRFFNFMISGFDAIVQIAKIVFGQIQSLFDKYIVSVGQGVRGLYRASTGDLSGATADIAAALVTGAQKIEPVGDQIFEALLKTQKTDYLQEISEGLFGLDPEIEKRAKARYQAFLDQQAEDARRRNELLNNLNGAPAEGTDRLRGGLGAEQKSLAKLIADFDIATKVALEFADAQEVLARAVDKGVISQQESGRLITELAQDKFRRLAAETDATAKATIEYNDTVYELRALMNAGKLSTDEFASAQSRLLDELLKVRENFEDTSWMDRFFRGVQDGFRRFGDSLGTTFGQISDLTNTLSEQGLSAIDKFVTTGEFDFREFSRNAIAEIQKVITRLILINAREDFQAGGIGGVFRGLYSDGARTGNGGTRASTDVGASAETGGLIQQLFGGQRPTKDQARSPLGTLADPLAVQIVSGLSATPAATPYGPQLPTDGTAATPEGAAVEQQGFFSSIGSFFTGLYDKLTGLFSSLFSNLPNLFSGISGLLGGGGGNGGLLGLAGKAIGAFTGFGGFLEGGGLIGPQQLGQAFITGEKRPELFVPRTTGTMLPNAAAALGGGAPPQVNVKVVNVDDAEGTLNQLATAEGEEVIMGMLQRRRGQLRELLV